MGKGEARVTATAAVASEVFVLTRDVFAAIKADKGADAASKALEAIQKVPALAQLPQPTYAAPLLQPSDGRLGALLRLA